MNDDNARDDVTDAQAKADEMFFTGRGEKEPCAKCRRDILISSFVGIGTGLVVGAAVTFLVVHRAAS